MKQLPGIHIQWPWSELLLSGEKTIETRSYPIPKKYLGKPLAIIETPGPKGKAGGKNKSQIVGVITFAECFQYENRESWTSDYKRHKVRTDDPMFSFRSDKPKWGWIVKSVSRLDQPKPPPKKRGIIFATACCI